MVSNFGNFTKQTCFKALTETKEYCMMKKRLELFRIFYAYIDTKLLDKLEFDEGV